MLCDFLQESANQILSLVTKTLEEMKSEPLTGPLYIGTGQTDNLNEIVKMMKLFQERYPHVQFHLLSDDKETLLKQLERNLLDFGLFIHDYDRNPYEGIPLKSTNSLGILAFKEHPFASKKIITEKDLKDEKITVARQAIQDQEIPDFIDNKQIVTVFDLPENVKIMVKENMPLYHWYLIKKRNLLLYYKKTFIEILKSEY